VSKVVFVLVLTVAMPSNAGEPLTIRVSPRAAMAPAIITVRAIIEADTDNRALEVIAQSPDFYRSSYVELDGANAQRVNVFQFRNLPSGTYEVTSVLVGSRGRRAAAAGYFQVTSSPGR